ncbi:hypothetical protein SAMN00790413_00872 [Deinococcus hopiensis KR-140]|uniref:Uncharacterized protein n=1 Tax=Deinococcus hopiensis KR-140 TaxID=695939 RepID=A0A1W1VBP6_9DEIO|nr:hypothetical protein SAMN00790413_00872 [Deinococcus hopiensis KR-140]
MCQRADFFLTEPGERDARAGEWRAVRAAPSTRGAIRTTALNNGAPAWTTNAGPDGRGSAAGHLQFARTWGLTARVFTGRAALSPVLARPDVDLRRCRLGSDFFRFASLTVCWTPRPPLCPRWLVTLAPQWKLGAGTLLSPGFAPPVLVVLAANGAAVGQFLRYRWPPGVRPSDDAVGGRSQAISEAKSLQSGCGSRYKRKHLGRFAYPLHAEGGELPVGTSTPMPCGKTAATPRPTCSCTPPPAPRTSTPT